MVAAVPLDAPMQSEEKLCKIRGKRKENRAWPRPRTRARAEWKANMRRTRGCWAETSTSLGLESLPLRE